MAEEERLNQELIASFGQQETFECSVCMDDKLMDDVAPVPGCDHKFCRECLREYLGSQLESGSFPILCPNCQAEQAEDPAIIPPILAEHIGLSDRQYEAWSKLDLQQYSIVIDCPHCQNSSLVDKDDYAAEQVVTCPLGPCRGRWCKDCNQKLDPGMGVHSCDGEKEMDEWIRQSKSKRCPECGQATQKTSGCNHMTCGTPGCNGHFCYIDGQLIIKSKVAPEIRAALERHYSGCRLFDYD
ncbi:hypothetical protein DL93DRAFT_2125877 [Clavulina sp. PMI_390]|nr:hypothetical protein DL93DRAFT_2125877 [Clavulina sp. PMI_390]